MYPLVHFILILLFLMASIIITAVNGAFRRIHNLDPNLEEIDRQLFYRSIHRYFFPEHEYEGLLIATISAQNLVRFFYATCVLLFLISTGIFNSPIILTFSLLGFILLGFTLGDYLARIFGAQYPELAVKYLGPIASILLFLAFPITWGAIKLTPKQFKSVSFEEPLTESKKELIEIIQKAALGPEMTLHDKKLIQSVLTFKDRIAREVMVPRVDVFSLSAETPIQEAAKLIQEEGYSRIPVYRNNVDNIVGVLMYKDILNVYMQYAEKGNDPSILEAPIETIQKNTLYTPETKKISNLLLEFKKQQVHQAIVVDEYGGTEGIVTIEDILEEIVGEISDEYDEEEEVFVPQGDGSWIVDARMNILDVDEQLGMKIPQEGDYDTIGGYIFHCAGSIPKKGFVIHQEEFELEILRSDERKVEKVRIRPIETPEIEEEPDES